MVTDVVMPGGINRFELADRPRPRRPELRVLFMSGYLKDISDGQPGSRHGKLLFKPGRVQEVQMALAATLSRKQLPETRGDAP